MTWENTEKERDRETDRGRTVWMLSSLQERPPE